MTHKSTWKRLERKIAKILHSSRTGNTGKSAPDVDHELFSVECKYRAKLGFIGWFKQAERYATERGTLPLLICKQKHQRGEYAIMRLSDFEAFMQAAKDITGDTSHGSRQDF